VPTLRKEPVFNLKAVVQQTGLKPDTLRAWERRYGLPHPERSSGGHRLYSQRDIDTIGWLLARQREGLSISRAVQLWERLQAEERDPVRAPAPLAMPTAPVPAQPTGGTIAQWRKQWIDACLAYDEQHAEQLLNQAFTLYSPETVALELLQRAVAEIGASWYRGDVAVQQEHFCSSLAVRRLEALVMSTPPPVLPGRILAVCPPEEHHLIGLLLLTFLLRRQGREVVYLGADVPLEQLESTVDAVRPQLVVMAAQLLRTAATLREVALVLQEAGVPLAYGGLIFNLAPTLRQRIPGHFLGEKIEAAPLMIESLLIAPRPAPNPEEIPALYRRAREHFEARQGLIDVRVIRALHSQGYAHNHLTLANREMGVNISAALALGDMDLIGTDIEWVTGLLRNYRLPAEALRSYVQAYYQAAVEELGEHGQPIIAWLEELLQGGDVSGELPAYL
jgi:DNA-binding transcriptional MerR regulator